MKLTDEELLKIIWKHQLTHATSIITTYIGDRYSLESFHGDEEMDRFCSYRNCFALSMVSRRTLTDKVGYQQLRKRIIKLIKAGKLISIMGECDFYLIDGELTKRAYKHARQFLLEKGLPEGAEYDANGSFIKMKTISLTEQQYKDILASLHKELLDKFEDKLDVKGFLESSENIT
jgi:hypothetical protein